MEYDLIEIQKTGGTSDTRKIRNVLRENYSHNKLLNEIKNKSRQSENNSTEQLENNSTEQLDNTMNLFD